MLMVFQLTLWNYRIHLSEMLWWHAHVINNYMINSTEPQLITKFANTPFGSQQRLENHNFSFAMKCAWKVILCHWRPFERSLWSTEFEFQRQVLVYTIWLFQTCPMSIFVFWVAFNNAPVITNFAIFNRWLALANQISV